MRLNIWINKTKATCDELSLFTSDAICITKEVNITKFTWPWKVHSRSIFETTIKSFGGAGMPSVCLSGLPQPKHVHV